MSPDQLFQFANLTAMAGWLALLASPWTPRISQLAAGLVVPIILSLGYTVLIMVNWAGSEGGFDSLANVALLFEDRNLLLAGWVHYLAFDLFVGAWEVRKGRETGISFLLIIPCLVLTFLFGPAGLLTFLALRFVRQGQLSAKTPSN